MKCKALYIIIFVFFSGSNYAQEIFKGLFPYNNFKTLTIDEGLSNNKVNCISSDTLGYIWFGTNEGLNKYDGFNFKTFKHDENNPNSLSHNVIRDIINDQNGDLIVATDRGLHIYDQINENFRLIQCYDGGIHVKAIVWSLVCDMSGNLWIGTSKGLFVRYKGKDAAVYYTNGINDVKQWFITSLYVDSSFLYIGTQNLGLFTLNLENKQVENFQNGQSDLNNISQDNISSIFKDSKGNIYIGTFDKGINLFNPYNGKFSKIEIENVKENNTRVRKILEDKSGNVWMGTYNGLYIKSLANNNFKRIAHSTNVYMKLVNNSIFDIYIDKDNVIWLGTYSGGVSYCDLNPKRFRYHGFKENDNQYLSGRVVHTIVETGKNTLWIGTERDGVNKYDKETGRYTYFNNQNSKLKSNNIKALLPDLKNEGLWIGCYKGGLNYMDLKTEKIDHITYNKENIESSNDIVNALCYDKEGNLWVAHNQGADRLPPGGSKLVHYKPFEEGGNISGASIFVDSDNEIWLGSSQIGILKFNRNKDNFEKIVFDSALSFNFDVKNICEDINGNFWLASSNGLYFINRANNDVKNYDEKDGLPSNTLFKLADDKNGNLWITTSHGMVRFNNAVFTPEEPDFTIFKKEDPLLIKQFVFNSHPHDRNGTIYFGGINGFISFNPDEIEINKTPPEAKIVNLYLFGKKVNVHDTINGKIILNKPVSLLGEIHLTHEHSVFSLEFAALNYAQSRNNIFEYKLEGFDDKWTTVDSEHKLATYTNLDGGYYTFKVKAANSDNVWNESPAILRIFIEPPFWEKWWFILTIVFAIIGITVLIIVLRTRSLRAQRSQLEMMVKLRTEEYESANEELLAMNDHLNTQKEELEKTLKEIKELQDHLVESEKMASIGMLASGVAHEINNPLNFILSGITGLDEYISENLKEHCGNVSVLINGIKTGVSRAANIVKSLNHFSRQSKLEYENCDVHVIINNCLIILDNQIKNRVNVIKSYHQDRVEIKANEGELHQAFLNILTNSVQAIEDKGTIEIKTRVIDKHLKISFFDNGSGIAPENINKISEPFFTTKEPGFGTGLGLSITYSIIKKHKGSLKFKSSLEKGTEVVVTLPL